jgi:hypothetical protein
MTYPRLVSQTEFVDFLNMIVTQIPPQQAAPVREMIDAITSGQVSLIKDSVVFESFSASSFAELSIFMTRRSVSANVAALNGDLDEETLDLLNMALVVSVQLAVQEAAGQFPVSVDITAVMDELTRDDDDGDNA